MINRLFIFCVILTLCHNICYGQHNNSIGLNFLAVKFNFEKYIQRDNYISIFDGLIYRHEYDKMTLRAFFNYNKLERNYYQGPTRRQYRHYYLFTAGTGLEKNIGFKKFRLYSGLDFFSNFSVYDFEVHNDSFELDKNFYHLWFGLRPFVGAQYKIFERMSLSIESNYNLGYRVLNTDENYFQIVSSYKDFFNPINAISISYLF